MAQDGSTPAGRSRSDVTAGGLKVEVRTPGQRATLKEVVDKFWRDPKFPMVPGEADVRTAIFDALTKDPDGITWELVDLDGQPLAVNGPDQLAIASSAPQLRIAEPDEPAEHVDGGEDGDAAGSSGPVDEPTKPSSTEYLMYTLTFRSKSLSDQYRNKVWLFLSKLAEVIDATSNVDIQVAGVNVTLTAPAELMSDEPRGHLCGGPRSPE